MNIFPGLNLAVMSNVIWQERLHANFNYTWTGRQTEIFPYTSLDLPRQKNWTQTNPVCVPKMGPDPHFGNHWLRSFPFGASVVVSCKLVSILWWISCQAFTGFVLFPKDADYVKSLGSRLLMTVYKGIAPGDDRKGLPSLDVNTRRVADGLLQLSFALSQQVCDSTLCCGLY